ncbi:MAG: hypothetical protein ACRCVT_02520 [Leadbetterella sp.]
MTQTSTQNDVLRYLYNETTVSENVEILCNLAFDEELNDFYVDTQKLIKQLDEVKLEVPQRAIDKILAYSANFTPALYQ